MKQIRNWQDLRPYGIDCLTGEACGYGYRVLCDLTIQGKQIVQNCLEITQLMLRDSWNNQIDGKPSIASIMLPPQMFTPLAVFALFDAGCRKVFIMHSGEVFGVEESDDQKQVDDFVKWHQGTQCDECGRYGKTTMGTAIQFQYTNAGYSRNRHLMSGRSV